MNKSTLRFIFKYCTSSPLFPIFFTLAIFIFRLPTIDLPIWDDATIFHYGWYLLHGQWHYLQVQWSPFLVGIAAIIQLLLYEDPIIGFFVFQGAGYVSIALGAYYLSFAFGYSRFFSSLLSCFWCLLIHTIASLADYPTLHLYHCGLPLLLSAYLVRRKPVSPTLAVLFIFLGFGVRNESILLLSLLFIAGCHRRKTGNIQVLERKHFVIPTVLISIFVSMLIGWKLRSENLDRMTIAFRQQFYTYALETRQYGASVPYSYARDEQAIEAAFGTGAGEMEIGGLLLRSPKTFLSFVLHNVQRFWNGELFGQSLFSLARFIQVSFLIGIVLLLIDYGITRDMYALFLLVAVLFKIPLVFLTVPRFYYMADIVFIALFASPPIFSFRRSTLITAFFAGGLIIMSFSSLLHYSDCIGGKRENMSRALFVRDALERSDSGGCIIAEAYAPFLQTFADRNLVQSVSLLNEIQRVGNRLYLKDGRLCDTVLIENGYPLPMEIKRWQRHQIPIAWDGKYSLYEQKIRDKRITDDEIAEPLVRVTDDFYKEQDLSGKTDHDSHENRMLALHWDLNQLHFDRSSIDDVRVYVKENQASYQFLGSPYRKTLPFLEWKRSSEWIEEPFRNGPLFGNRYRFEIDIYFRKNGIPFVMPIFTAASVLFQPVVTVCDDFRSQDDLSSGVDTDPVVDRQLVIRWSPDSSEVERSKVTDIHLYVRIDDAVELDFLGRTGDPTATYFLWGENSKYLSPTFLNGPEFGHRYEFWVYFITREREYLKFPVFRSHGSLLFARKKN